MNYNISFEERAKLAAALLSKQLPVTLEQARQQAEWLKAVSTTKQKKTGSCNETVGNVI